MIKNNLVYLFNQDFNPICRDAGKPYAESLGLKYDYLPTWREYLSKDYNLIVDTGWKTEDSIKILEDILQNGDPSRIILRVVDDYPQTYSNLDIQFINNELLRKFRLVSPYRHVYFGYHVAKWVPYHYEIDDEIENDFNEFLSRNPKPLLTGALDRQIYPIRAMYADCGNVEIMTHPGYSGRCWEGNVGKAYLQKLSKYRFMVMSTCYHDFELLKYIECAEAGCCPIGEFTKSMLAVMPDNLRKLQRFDDLSEIRIGGPYGHYLAMQYRRFIKTIYSKTLVINKINNLFK